MSLVELEREVAVRVQEAQPLVIERVLSLLDSTENCSYSRWMPYYRGIQVTLSKLKRKKWDWYYDRMGYGRPATANENPYLDLWVDQQVEANETRGKLYKNPCYVCEACLSRRRRWPTVR